MTKAEKIKQAIKETKERRRNLRPVVYQLKIQNLSKKMSTFGIHRLEWLMAKT